MEPLIYAIVVVAVITIFMRCVLILFSKEDRETQQQKLDRKLGRTWSSP